jgi:hypothetical protein
MKKATTIVTVLLCATVILAISCSKTSEDKLSTPDTGCDTTNVMYSADVVPILKANCYSCHGDGQLSGGVNLDTYENVKIQADNGALLGSITHAPGYSPMPDDLPKLPDCNINIIRAWINNGTPNN